MRAAGDGGRAVHVINPINELANAVSTARSRFRDAELKRDEAQKAMNKAWHDLQVAQNKLASELVAQGLLQDSDFVIQKREPIAITMCGDRA